MTLELTKRLSHIEVGIYKRKIYLDIFQQPLLNEEEANMEESLYTTIARKDSFDRPYAIQKLLSPYKANSILKTFGITIVDIMRMSLKEIHILNEFAVKNIEDDYKNMKEILEGEDD